MVTPAHATVDSDTPTPAVERNGNIVASTIVEPATPPDAAAGTVTPPPAAVDLVTPAPITVESVTPTPAAIDPSIPTKPLQEWARPFPVEEGKLIKVIVQYVSPETPNTCWVMLSEHEVESNSMLESTHHGVITSSSSCQPGDINLNSLYAVPFEQFYYRAVCIEAMNSFDEVKFRLVDHGNEFYANVNEVKKPIPLMCEEHAFAFKIKYNGRGQGVLSTGTELNIIVYCESKLNNLYYARIMKTIPSSVYSF